MKFYVWAGLLCVLICGVWAGPLNRADLPAQPHWVLHFDCEALRGTKVGARMLADFRDPELQSRLAGFPIRLNFDPAKKLRGLTAFGLGPYEDEGVLLFYADFDEVSFLSMARARSHYAAFKSGPDTLHSWVETSKRKEVRVYSAVHRGRILFAQRADAIAPALAALRGGPNLKNTGLFPKLAAVRAPILGVSRLVRLDADQPGAALLKFVRGTRFEMTEANEQVKAALTLETTSPEASANVLSLAQGLRFVMRLQSGRPELALLAQTAVLSQSGSNALCAWTLPATEAIEALQALSARKSK